MTIQTTQADQILQRERVKDYKEYNAAMPYTSLIGNGIDKPIQRDNSLAKRGESVKITLTHDIGNRNVGAAKLSGNEQTFGQSTLTLQPIWHRDGLRLKKDQVKKAITNHLGIQRYQLRTGAANHKHVEFNKALDAIATDPSALREEATISAAGVVIESAHNQQVNYAEASVAQRNAYVTANAGKRILFGAADTNTVVGDMAASLLNVDDTADKLSPQMIKRMKRLALRDEWETGGVRPIRPMRVNEAKGQSFYQVFTTPEAFSDFGENEDVKRYNTDARLRGVEGHVIFQGGYLIYDGCIIMEDPKLRGYAGVGAGGIDVAPVYMLGAQALGLAVGQEFEIKVDGTNDYKFEMPLGYEEQYSVEKLFFKNGLQHGMVTGYAAGVGI